MIVIDISNLMRSSDRAPLNAWLKCHNRGEEKSSRNRLYGEGLGPPPLFEAASSQKDSFESFLSLPDSLE